MATKRLSMHKNREILRQKWALGRSHREVAKSVGVSIGAITNVLQQALKSGLSWEAADQLEDDELEKKLFGETGETPAARPLPDFRVLHLERRKKGVTLQLLHEEYLREHPSGYQYTQFCTYYRRWVKRRGLTMKILHHAGDKCFIDYSGAKLHLTDPQTGERVAVELFVAVLGASNYTYAEASATQRGVDFIASNVRALEFFGGAPAALVPDQLKSAVARSCRYDPKIQRTYEELARHYQTTVFPARPRKPRDKAKVEVAVQIAQRWIIARLRNEEFTTLEQLNARLAELLEELNNREMRKYGASRRELFERLDKPALRPLPRDRFVYFDWKRVRVNIDYHVDVDGHYYSVPFSLVHEELEARYTASTVWLLHRGQRVATHPRRYRRGGHSTIKQHMPKAHRKHMEWSPSRLTRWSAKIGPKTHELIDAILRERKHPEQGYRTCLGILRLAKRYGGQRLEAACARAVLAGARSYRNVDSILKNGLDRVPLPEAAPPAHDNTTAVLHENIRGPRHYH